MPDEQRQALLLSDHLPGAVGTIRKRGGVLDDSDGIVSGSPKAEITCAPTHCRIEGELTLSPVVILTAGSGTDQ
jgi:hypothetical protein